MRSHRIAPTAPALAPRKRCAIYTRKSTDEGLDQDYNSLEAQRDAGLAFVASQRHEGWMAVPDGYDDGGYSGGNLDRPGLKRLMVDIDAGRIDIVVVYKGYAELANGYRRNTLLARRSRRCIARFGILGPIRGLQAGFRPISAVFAGVWRRADGFMAQGARAPCRDWPTQAPRTSAWRSSRALCTGPS